MIRKLKAKFIALAMTALFALLAVIVVGMNLINYNAVVSEADATLELLSQNKGSFPAMGDDKNDRLPHGISPELPYESRYFSALLNQDGEVMFTETSKITSVNADSATEYAQAVIARGSSRGFIDQFRFVCRTETSGTRIIFLDCGRKLDSFHTFLYASMGMALAGLVIVFFVIFFFAGRIIRPIAESYEKQKRFITEAGHEIKTPLTIINANVDLLEMEFGEGNECLEDIQLQTQRLTTLTNDLVLLSRMEEAENSIQTIDFPISEVVSDAALPFRALAHAQGKGLTCRIQPTLTMNGDAKSIQQLVSILMDNAMKYSASGSEISLNLEKNAKNICLTVTNVTEIPIPPDSLPHLFDRFYRADASRNSETGGHGIGLSVAKAIVTAHGGKIQAHTPEEGLFRITVTLPQ